MGTHRYRLLGTVVALLAAGLTGTALLAPAPAFAIASETPIPSWGTGPLPPPNPQGKEWQDGRVYTIARGGGRIFVGGVFTQAVPPDGSSASPVPRAGLLALDAATGALVAGFDAHMNGDEVRALAVSPDGATLYVGGRFTAMGGAPNRNLAALDAATGTARPGWQAGTDQEVFALAALGNVVYVGGKFATVTDAAGTHGPGVLAALVAADGRVVSGWNPVLTGCANTRNGCVGPAVEAITQSADGATLYAGGEIDHADGIACTICALDPDTGVVDPNFRPPNSREVFALATDATHVYAALGGGGGAGVSFNAATGSSAWEIRGDGNFQGVAVFDGVIYFGGHFADVYPVSVAGRPVTQVHYTRHKMVAVDVATSQINLSYDPVVNSPLGIFVLVGTPGRIDIGGDFDTVSGVHQPHYAMLDVPGGGPPGAPAGVTAVPGNGSATVSWTAPTSDGGSAITGYTVTAYAGGAVAATVGAASVGSVTVAGLTNGTAYTFRVIALNVFGPGPASAPSAPVTPRTVPGAPIGVNGVPGDRSVALSWARPTDNGGAAISAYTVTARTPATSTSTTVSGATLAATVMQLANGVAYTLDVTATNAAGTGPASYPSAAITPRTVPGAPTAVSAEGGDGLARVSWSPPADDGGAPILAYTVTARLGPTTAGAVSVPAPAAFALVSGLVNGSAYSFTITATNAAGTGPASEASPVVIPSADAPLTPAASLPASGYWLLGSDGAVYPFGGALSYGQPEAASLSGGAVDIEATPSRRGYWVVDSVGRVQPFGDADPLGDVRPGVLASGELVTSLSSTPTGAGYWVFTSRGRVIAFGDAMHRGDMAAVALNGPVLDSIATPSAQGYYMVASDGGIFAFGDARFSGSMGGRRLNAPVRSAVPDPDGDGYWLVATDGGVFAFDAPFRGSAGALHLNGPVTGMVAFGNGYLLVGTDGGVFNYSDQPFSGSLGAHRPARPIVSVAAVSSRQEPQ